MFVKIKQIKFRVTISQYLTKKTAYYVVFHIKADYFLYVIFLLCIQDICLSLCLFGCLFFGNSVYLSMFYGKFVLVFL